MTATGTFLDARPQVRPEVVLGPGLVKGAKVLHNLKDPRTGRFYQVGAKEFFLISRLDGTRSLADIGVAYAERFRRRVDEQRWQQMLGMLAARRLLVGTEDPVAMAELTELAKQQVRGDRTLFKARLSFLDPDALLGRLEPRLRFMFGRTFVVPAVVLAGAVMSWVAFHIPELAAEMALVRANPTATGVLVAVYWLSIAMHETAHGLTCKHFGGSAHEIGVMWRFPIVAPYCDANDVVLLGSRWQRVSVAFAGAFTTLILIIPFGLLRLLAPDGSALAGLGSALLLFSSLGVVFNLVPLFQLDGYFMLNHALGMQNLRQESSGYLLLRLRGGRTAVAAYGRRERAIYTAYGTASLLFGTATAVLAAWWLFTVLRPLLGPGRAVVGVLVAACVVVTAALIARRQRQRKLAQRGAV